MTENYVTTIDWGWAWALAHPDLYLIYVGITVGILVLLIPLATYFEIKDKI